jgi:hypothetical protein
MRKLLLTKLSAIRSEIKGYENLSSFKDILKGLRAQELLIIEIMIEYDTMCRKPIIEDIERDFNMGIISLQDKENQINSILIDY